MRKACDAGDVKSKGCFGLGVLHFGGRGVKLDHAPAATLLERGCDAGAPYGCYNLAGLVERGDGRPEDAAQAPGLYAKACEKGVQIACAQAQPPAR